MKKLMLFALSALFAVSASAQDVAKLVKKAKTIDEAVQIINNGGSLDEKTKAACDKVLTGLFTKELKTTTSADAVESLISKYGSSMSDQSKGDCYKKLYDIYKQAMKPQTDILAKNEENRILKKPEVAYDTLALSQNSLLAYYAASNCCKANPKMAASLGAETFGLRGHILNGGIYFNDQNNTAEVIKYFQAFVDSKDDAMFAAVPAEQKKVYDQNIGQIAYYTAYYGSQQDKGQDFVNKYADIAAADAKYAKDAEAIKNNYAAKGLKNHEDSVAYAAKLQAKYDADPSNIQNFQTLAMIYLGLNEADKFYAVCQKRIEAMPNDHIAYYFRGQIRCMLRQYQEALPDLEKADELKPNDSGINAFIGQCWIGRAEEAENRAAGKSGIIPRTAKTQIKPVWDKALSYLNKAKELDTDGSNERNYKSKIQTVLYNLETYYKGIE